MIPPGRSGKVVAKVHTAGHIGPMAKSVAVETDDPLHPVTNLEVRFEVHKPVEPTPAVVQLYGPPGQPMTSTVILHRPDGKPLTVLKVEAGDTGVTARFEPVTESGRSRPGTWPISVPGDVRLVVSAPPGPAGRRLQGMLKVVTDHPQSPNLDLPLSIEVTPLVRPQPGQVFVSRTAPAAPGQGEINLVHQALQPFRVSGVELRGDLPGCTAQVTSAEPGASQSVRVECTGPVPEPGPHRGVLVARTGLPEMPTVEVPVLLRVAPAVPAATRPQATGALP